MNFDNSFYDRLAFFLIGVLVGLVLSWLKDIRKREIEIKQELDEVVEIVKKQDSNEGGFIRLPSLSNILLFAVVTFTLWASFATANTNNNLEQNQKEDDAQSLRIEAITTCNQEYLFKTIKALNERTTYSQTTADSNVALQKGLAEFIDILLFQPPKTELERRQALERFDEKLAEYVENAGKTKVKTQSFPYPTEDELANCLEYEMNTTTEAQQ